MFVTVSLILRWLTFCRGFGSALGNQQTTSVTNVLLHRTAVNQMKEGQAMLRPSLPAVRMVKHS
jgi:hypothetical protein